MNQFYNLLESMIRCRPLTSQPDNINRAAEILRKFLEERGIFCKTEQYRGRDLLYASNCGEEEPDVLLNAHLDVVPADDAQFQPFIQDGRMYGRGTADCLGNAVCAARTLLNATPGTKIAAAFSADEETGGDTTAAMVKFGFRAKRVILIMDNSDPSVIFSQKGVLVVKLTAHGKGGHAAYPWLCDNPIDKLMTGYAKFLAFWKNPAEDNDWRSSLSACMMEAGSAHNQIPETASMILNFRLIDEKEQDKVLSALTERTGCEATVVSSMPTVSFDRDLPEFTLLQKMLRKNDPAHDYPLERLCGATDSRHWKVLGIPVAVTGILGAEIHSPGEYIELDSIRTTSNAVIQFADAISHSM